MLTKNNYNNFTLYPIILFLLLSGVTVIIHFFRKNDSIIINNKFNVYNKILLLFSQTIFIVFWSSIILYLSIKDIDFKLYIFLISLIFFGLSIMCIFSYYIDSLKLSL